MNNEKALVIDGNSIMFRAFYATYKQLEYFKQNNLQPNNALKTMSQMLFNINNNQYKYLVIAFDPKGGSFRNAMSEDYKANRKATPEELVIQIPLIHEMSKLMGFNVYCIEGIEADDVVGSASKLFSKNKIHCDVFSSDQDMFQLIDEYITVKTPLNGGGIKTYDHKNFAEQYFDLIPSQVKDYKAIAGDKSDNIPGVKGIGQKGAVALIKKFNTLENIYECIDEIESKNLKNKLIESKEIAFFSKEIATILINHFDDKNPNDFLKQEINIDDLKKFFENQRIRSFERYLI